MLLPQEIEVYYVIPAIRKELSIKLKESGLKQKEIAKIFGVSEACISNYSKNKRANINLSSDIKELIKQKTIELKKGECSTKIISNICSEFKKKGLLCELHKKLEPINCKNKRCLL